MYGERSLFEGRYRFALPVTLFEGITAVASSCSISLGSRPGLRKGYCSHTAEPHIPSAAFYYRAKDPALRTRLVYYQMKGTTIRVTTRGRQL